MNDPSAGPDRRTAQPPERSATNGHDDSEHSASSSTSNFFNDLDALRLSPEAAATAGTREFLAHVPVRKPNRTEFFRVHPDPDMALATGVFDDKVEREVFIIAPTMRSELGSEMKLVLLSTAINRQGVVFLWPMSLPDQSGRSNAWWDTARRVRRAGKNAMGKNVLRHELRCVSKSPWPRVSCRIPFGPRSRSPS